MQEKKKPDRGWRKGQERNAEKEIKKGYEPSEG